MPCIHYLCWWALLQPHPSSFSLVWRAARRAPSQIVCEAAECQMQGMLGSVAQLRTARCKVWECYLYHHPCASCVIGTRCNKARTSVPGLRPQHPLLLQQRCRYVWARGQVGEALQWGESRTAHCFPTRGRAPASLSSRTPVSPEARCRTGKQNLPRVHAVTSWQQASTGTLHHDA